MFCDTVLELDISHKQRADSLWSPQKQHIWESKLVKTASLGSETARFRPDLNLDD